MKPLTAKDLMIGDWVFDCKNISYNRMTSEALCAFEDGQLAIIPIPLTKEILKKNGFEYDHYYHNWIYNEFTINYGHLIDEDDGDYLFIWVADTSVKLTYVHELQHALRLCGIEKEINL